MTATKTYSIDPTGQVVTEVTSVSGPNGVTATGRSLSRQQWQAVLAQLTAQQASLAAQIAAIDSQVMPLFKTA
jgi:hypothetical protein